DPEVAVRIALCAVARKVEIGTAWPLREIGLHVAIVVAPDGPEHRREWLGDGEQSAANWNSIGLRIEQLGGVSGQRHGRAAGFRRRDARKWRDGDRAGFSLPPRVDDGASATTDVFVIPHPGFRIDRLADAA